MHLLKIPRVRQSIGSCFATIIQNNDNDNIKFYLQDITQAYIEIALEYNPNLYIRQLFKLISQLNTTFDSIVKVIRSLYGKPEVDNQWFAIYHLYYKEKSKMIKSTYNPFLLQLLPKLLSSPGASSDFYSWKYLVAAFFLTYNGGAYITKPSMRIDLSKVPLIICTNFYLLFQHLIQLGKTSKKQLRINIIALK